MRKIDITLAQSKLETKKIQLSQIEARVVSLKAELDAVVAKRDAKLAEVSQLGTTISTAQNSTVVSK